MVLLSSAQFAKNVVVIYSTVCRGKRQDFCKIYCYPAHNSEKFTGFLGLLSAAHFCCRAKIKVVMYGTFPKILPAFPLLLFAAHFPGGGLLFTAQFDFLRIFLDFCKISDFSAPVVIRSTIPTKVFWDFWVLESSAQFEWFPEFQKSRLWGCYSAHSSQNPPNRHRTILAQKIIFSGCYARHIVALRTKQLLFTAHRSWNPRHIYVVIFDTAIHYF